MAGTANKLTVCGHSLLAGHCNQQKTNSLKTDIPPAGIFVFIPFPFINRKEVILKLTQAQKPVMLDD
jgi:hypothetical protein